MNPIVFGLIAGLVFGAIDIALMIPMAKLIEGLSR